MGSLKIFFTLLVFFAFGQVTASPRTEGALETELKDQTFKAKVKAGFHFNEKAPNNLIIDGKKEYVIKPTQMTAREGVFSNLPTTWSQAVATLYICDDALTFCETRRVELKGGAKAKISTNAPAHKSQKARINHHGFIENDYAKALELATQKQQLVLVDFAARWCPPCMRMETEIFGTAEFKKMTAQMIKVRLDTDLFENSIIAEKYKVRGIPTMLVINTQQQEIARVLDYQPLSTWDTFFSAVQENSTPIDEMIKTAKAGDNSKLQTLGERLLLAGRTEEALEFLNQVKPVPAPLLTARISVARQKYQEDKNKKKFIKTLQETINQEPSSTRSLEWRGELASELEDTKQKSKIVQDGVSLADQLLGDETKLAEATKTEDVGEFTGFTRPMVAMRRAELIESGGASEAEVKAAWQKAAEVVRAAQIPISNVGLTIRTISVLGAAGEYNEADKLIVALLKKSKDDPELNRRRAGIFLKQKKYAESIALSKKVIKQSYGRNEFWVAEVLAEAYLGAGQKQEAKKLLDDYLSRTEMEWRSLAGSKKSLEALRAKAL